MSAWNFDISAIPRGHHEKKTRVIKGEPQEYDVFVPERVWAANKDDKVYSTYWIEPSNHEPKGRWSGWSAGDEPIAWQPYVVPLHPHHMVPADLCGAAPENVPLVFDEGGD